VLCPRDKPADSSHVKFSMSSFVSDRKHLSQEQNDKMNMV
jgi:hypothetical protein